MPICRMIFPSIRSDFVHQESAGSSRHKDRGECSQNFGRSAVEYSKSRAGLGHAPAKGTRSPRSPLKKTRLPPQCPRMGPVFLRGILPPEARRVSSAFSPSYLASVRLFCQPNINGRPLASQTRHSHSVGLHSHLVIITSNMIRAEYIERHRYHDVGLPAVDRIRHQHQAVPPNSPRTNQRRKIAARKLQQHRRLQGDRINPAGGDRMTDTRLRTSSLSRCLGNQGHSRACIGRIALSNPAVRPAFANAIGRRSALAPAASSP